MSDPTLRVLFRREEESWQAFARRIRDTEAEDIFVIIASTDGAAFMQEQQFEEFLGELAGAQLRIRIAVRQKEAADRARKKGLRVIDRTKQLKQILAGHPQEEEALRLFSPSLWRQHWRSRLQSAGLLTVPRFRITTLIILSVGLFLFVIFRLLPSAEIAILPRGDMAIHTVNVFLTQSGAMNLPEHVRTLPLIPIDISVRRSLVFEQISKQFIGTNAKVPMTIVNKSREQYGLREGTRVRNQAGMVFRLQRAAIVPPGGDDTVPAEADEMDTFGEIIGERGNVPAGVRWEIPGLTEDERKLIYAENRAPAQGGRTAYRNALQQSDLDIARRRLEQELVSDAKKEVEERILGLNGDEPGRLRLLTSEQLVRSTFTGFVLPTDLLNQPVAAINAEGGLEYLVFAYDAQSILDTVSQELEERVAGEKKLLKDTLSLKNLELRVFDYADDLVWIKATVELTATEQFVLDPLTPAGARFAKGVREKVAGMTREEAVRYVKNLPEVEKVEIHLWPPWGRVLPTIPSSIAIVML